MLLLYIQLMLYICSSDTVTVLCDFCFTEALVNIQMHKLCTILQMYVNLILSGSSLLVLQSNAKKSC